MATRFWLCRLFPSAMHSAGKDWVKQADYRNWNQGKSFTSFISISIIQGLLGWSNIKWHQSYQPVLFWSTTCCRWFLGVNIPSTVGHPKNSVLAPWNCHQRNCLLAQGSLWMIWNMQETWARASNVLGEILSLSLALLSYFFPNIQLRSAMMPRQIW